MASFPSFNVKRRVSIGGGSFPVWAGKGRELLYVTRDRKYFTAQIQMEPNLVTGTPKLLFSTVTSASQSLRFAVTADGERFLIVEAPKPTEPEESGIRVVLNWAEGLSRGQ